MLDDRVPEGSSTIPTPIISGSSAMTGLQAADNAYLNYNQDSIIKDWQKAASEGDVAAQEKLFNYFATKESEKTARDWTAQREDTQYQRLMSDLSKAGISPYVLTGATPASSSATYSSHSGSQMTSSQSSENSREATIKSALLRLMALGLIAVTRLV